MTKPGPECLEAIRVLTSAHKEDCAVYYSTDGEQTVMVISDPEIAERMIYLLGLFNELDDAPDTEEIDGISVLRPVRPIEA